MVTKMPMPAQSKGSHGEEEGEDMLQVQRLRDKDERFLSSGVNVCACDSMAAHSLVFPTTVSEGARKHTKDWHCLTEALRDFARWFLQEREPLPPCHTTSIHPADQAERFSREKCCHLKCDAALSKISFSGGQGHLILVGKNTLKKTLTCLILTKE